MSFRSLSHKNFLVLNLLMIYIRMPQKMLYNFEMVQLTKRVSKFTLKLLILFVPKVGLM
jgi:hypothetical protein